MRGHIYVWSCRNDGEERDCKKITAEFNSDFIEVIMPIEGMKYMGKDVKQDCQAYCSRVKRVSQFHPANEN